MLTQQQDVDVSSHPVHASGASVLVHPAKQGQRHTCLHVAVPVDGRRDGPNNALCDLNRGNVCLGIKDVKRRKYIKRHRRRGTTRIFI